MQKLTKAILVSSLAFAVMILFAGCMNIPAQLNNFSSEVNPLPFPTVQRLVKDAVATSHEPDSVGIISFSPDAKWYDVTLGYCVGVWRCFGKRCAVSAIQPPGKHVSA